MAKTYEVLELSFINGRLYHKGERVALEIDAPGGNLGLVTEEESGVNEKDELLAELKALGIEADKRSGLEKLRAILADAKGE